MALITTKEAARRLARTIASDTLLYNDEKVTKGIQEDTLFESLEDEIQEGRALFLTRVDPSLLELNLYDRALVDILVRSKGHVPSKMW